MRLKATHNCCFVRRTELVDNSVAMCTCRVGLRRVAVSIVALLSLVYSTTAQNRSHSDCSETLDVIFLLDSSLSVRQLCPLASVDGQPVADNWQLMLRFVSEVLGALPLDSGRAHVGVASFSTSLSVDDIISLEPGSAAADASALRGRVERLPFLGGNTNATGALRFAGRELASARAARESRGDPGVDQQYVVLLTDGVNNVDTDPVQETRLLKQDNVRLITVGISEYVDEAQLKEIASAPATYSYIHARDFNHLNLLVDQLLNKLVCSNPPPAQPCRDSRADIAFVLDASGSIIYKSGNSTANFDNWNLMKAFVITLIRNLQVSANDTRIALVRFSHESSVVFDLSTYFSSSQAIEAVQNMSIVASSTNTSSALNTMTTRVFNPVYGDRLDVNNVGIIITDGQSDDDAATEVQAAAAKRAGVRMFAIGLTDEIDADELQLIASAPLDEHYFNRTSIALVQTVASQLLWSVCHAPCPSAAAQPPDNCRKFCEMGERLTWTHYPGHLLLGRSYAILTDVSSAAQCQSACLLDYQCRSVQFIAALQHCSISYYSRQQAPDSFRADSQVDYYEISCVAQR